MILQFLLLVGIWLALTGDATWQNVLLGLFMSSGALWLSRGNLAAGLRVGVNARRIVRAVELLLFFLWEVVVSGVRVAIEVLRPQMRLSPAIVAIPVKDQPPTGVMLLANLITMTPGTLSLVADEEKQLLYVHGMQVQDMEQFRQKVQVSFARRIQEVLT